MSGPTVWGASYSVYSRILRLALLEKGIEHDWVEIDVFDSPADRAAQATRHPWAKMPAMADEGQMFYETGACLAWLEQPRFGPARLWPEDPLERARAFQVASIVDAYAYPSMVWQVFVPLERGASEDDASVADGLAASETALDALEDLATGGPALIGSAPSIADCYLAPVVAYFAATDPGGRALARRARLSGWWREWKERPAMQATRFARGAG